MAVTSTRSVPLLDLRAQHRAIRQEVAEAVERVFETQAFILGSEVDALEREVAAYCGSPHAIGCASGTDALVLALMALDVGPGDEVLTVPFSFFATASCITRLGATPVFVDVLPDTFNMDPAALERALNRHPKAKVILPVHLFGDCADMDAILAVAAARGIPVVEDAAQAIGAEDKRRRAGSIGAIGCFSFFPTKNLGGAGDGGMLTTADPVLAERLKSLRVHGSRVRYYHDEVGLNSRLDALQAAVLRVKLRHLDSWTAGRQTNAQRYISALSDLNGVLQLPVLAAHSTRHVYNQFTIRAQRRDELRAFLDQHGVRSELYYPLPLHLQTCFQSLGYAKGDFPVSEACASDCLSLPIYPELSESDLDYVSSQIRNFYTAR